MERIERTEDEWWKQLTGEQDRVARQAGTERPLSGEYWDTTDSGVFDSLTFIERLAARVPPA